MELGISMFADLHLDETTGKRQSAGMRLKELMTEIMLADELGLDVFGIGEHHRADYAVSSPEIILAAAASVTKNIILSSAVTVLSSADPVKVYQDFATIDLLSNGRAEITAGRGSFIESFPLFGFDLDDYNDLFEEKLNLLLKINSESPINWKGRFRPELKNQQIFPHPLQAKLPVWIAVGGTPGSVERAARLGLPLVIAILGGDPRQFAPFYKFYREQYIRNGHNPADMGLGLHVHTFLGENGKTTADHYFPYYAAQMKRIGAERGWPAYSKSQYEMNLGKNGALFVGDPSAITDKILMMHELFGLTRFVAHMDVGAPPHAELLKSIELFGNVVAPAVRKALA
ncbi:MAG: LLM class flavin-dependent oxidoreductase [Bacteroidota bacterium]|nr:LLM class flavin-dependent oxidoreductase [Bacteroidota bacterium]